MYTRLWEMQDGARWGEESVGRCEEGGGDGGDSRKGMRWHEKRMRRVGKMRRMAASRIRLPAACC